MGPAPLLDVLATRAFATGRTWARRRGKRATERHGVVLTWAKMAPSCDAISVRRDAQAAAQALWEAAEEGDAPHHLQVWKRPTGPAGKRAKTEEGGPATSKAEKGGPGAKRTKVGDRDGGQPSDAPADRLRHERKPRHEARQVFGKTGVLGPKHVLDGRWCCARCTSWRPHGDRNLGPALRPMADAVAHMSAAAGLSTSEVPQAVAGGGRDVEKYLEEHDTTSASGSRNPRRGP